MTKRIRALCALLVLASCRPCLAARLRVGMAIPSYAHGVLWIAQDGGFFQKQGLDAEVTVLGGSSDAMKLLLAGKVDIVLAGGDSLVKADLAGGDLVAFAGIVNTFFHRIVTRPDIKRPSDLKGRAIGLPFLGGPQDMMVKVALKRWGLGYGTDVKVRNMGAEYARLSAVQKGIVDAVTSDAAPSTLKELNLTVLGDVPAWRVPFPYMMAVTRRGFLADNEPTAEKFLRALTEAMRFYKTHEKESLAILSRHMPGDDELYRQNGPSTYTFPPYPDPAGFQTVLDFVKADDPDAARHKPQEYFTDAVVDRLK